MVDCDDSRLRDKSIEQTNSLENWEFWIEIIIFGFEINGLIICSVNCLDRVSIFGTTNPRVSKASKIETREIDFVPINFDDIFTVDLLIDGLFSIIIALPKQSSNSCRNEDFFFVNSDYKIFIDFF